MITKDHISFNGDGTAWIVFERFVRTEHGMIVAPIVSYDRPCDTCDGDGQYIEITCDDCSGTGRHTFTVEVANQCAFHQAKLHENGHPDRGHCICGERPDTFRVSVVPGMVAQIVSTYDADGGHTDHGEPGTVEWVDTDWHCAYLWTDDGPQEITLPPAAAPDMYAVKVALA